MQPAEAAFAVRMLQSSPLAAQMMRTVRPLNVMLRDMRKCDEKF